MSDRPVSQTTAPRMLRGATSLALPQKQTHAGRFRDNYGGSRQHGYQLRVAASFSPKLFFRLRRGTKSHPFMFPNTIRQLQSDQRGNRWQVWTLARRWAANVSDDRRVQSSTSGPATISATVRPDQTRARVPPFHPGKPPDFAGRATQNFRAPERAGLPKPLTCCRSV